MKVKEWLISFTGDSISQWADGVSGEMRWSLTKSRWSLNQNCPFETYRKKHKRLKMHPPSGRVYLSFSLGIPGN